MNFSRKEWPRAAAENEKSKKYMYAVYVLHSYVVVVNGSDVPPRFQLQCRHSLFIFLSISTFVLTTSNQGFSCPSKKGDFACVFFKCLLNFLS